MLLPGTTSVPVASGIGTFSDLAVNQQGLDSATSLRACYAMSGTDLVSGPICLRKRYALSDTDLAYGGFAISLCLS
eukprot:3941399-Rhodomonas_salina.4